MMALLYVVPVLSCHWFFCRSDALGQAQSATTGSRGLHKLTPEYFCYSTFSIASNDNFCLWPKMCQSRKEKHWACMQSKNHKAKITKICTFKIKWLFRLVSLFCHGIFGVFFFKFLFCFIYLLCPIFFTLKCLSQRKMGVQEKKKIVAVWVLPWNCLWEHFEPGPTCRVMEGCIIMLHRQQLRPGGSLRLLQHHTHTGHIWVLYCELALHAGN